MMDSRPGLPPSARPRRGFTLIEVVVSMMIFTLLCLGILAVVLHLRRLAEANVYENTALTMGQGYIEQLRSLSYNDLLAAATTSSALSLRGANMTILADEGGGVFQNNDWAREVVMLDRTEAGQDTQPMSFRFQVSLSDLGTSAIGPNGVEITLTYETVLPLTGGGNRTLRRTLRTVRSIVPSY